MDGTVPDTRNSHTYSASDDRSLLAAGVRGDESAVGELYARHRTVALKYATRLVGASEAEDLVSEAFARILVRIRARNAPSGAFRPYLLTTVYHLFLEFGRRDSRSVPVADLSDLHGTAAPTTSDLEMVVANEFGKLPENWQVALWHSIVEGEPSDTTADRLGTTAQGLRAMTYRARKALFDSVVVSMPSADIECTQVRQWMADTHSLGVRDSRALKKHLAGCAECVEMKDFSPVANAGIFGAALGVALVGPAAKVLIASGHIRRIPVVAAALALLVVPLVLLITQIGGGDRAEGEPLPTTDANSPQLPVTPGEPPTSLASPDVDDEPVTEGEMSAETEPASLSQGPTLASSPQPSVDSAPTAPPPAVSSPTDVVPDVDSSTVDSAGPPPTAPLPLAINAVTVEAGPAGDHTLSVTMTGTRTGDTLTLNVPGVDRVSVVSSGTDATLSCRPPSDSTITCRIGATSDVASVRVRLEGSDSVSGGSITLRNIDGESANTVLP